MRDGVDGPDCEIVGFGDWKGAFYAEGALGRNRIIELQCGWG